MSSINILSRYEDKKAGLSYWRIASKKRPSEDEIFTRLTEEALLDRAPVMKQPIIHIVHPEKNDLREEEQSGKLPKGYLIYEVTIIDVAGKFWRQKTWSAEVHAYLQIAEDAQREYLWEKAEQGLPKDIFFLEEMPKIISFQHGQTVDFPLFQLTACDRLAKLLPLIQPFVTTIYWSEKCFGIPSDRFDIGTDALGGQTLLVTNEDHFCAILFHQAAGSAAHFHVYDQPLKDALLEELKKS